MTKSKKALDRYLEPQTILRRQKVEGYVLHLASPRMAGHDNARQLFENDRERCVFTDVSVEEDGFLALADPSAICSWRMPVGVPPNMLPIWTMPSYKINDGYVVVLRGQESHSEALGNILAEVTAVVIHGFDGAIWDEDSADLLRSAWIAEQCEVPIYYSEYGAKRRVNAIQAYDAASSRSGAETFRYNYAVNFSHLVMPAIRDLCGNPTRCHTFFDPVTLQILYRLRRAGVLKASSEKLSEGVFFDDYEYEHKIGWHHSGARKILDDHFTRSVQWELFEWGLVTKMDKDADWNSRLTLTEKGERLLNNLPAHLEDEGMPCRWPDSRYGEELTDENLEEMKDWMLTRFGAMTLQASPNPTTP